MATEEIEEKYKSELENRGQYSRCPRLGLFRCCDIKILGYPYRNRPDEEMDALHEEFKPRKDSFQELQDRALH